MEATRQAVYEAIDGERDYQEKTWGHKRDYGRETVSEFICLLAYYVAKANEKFTTSEGDCPALNEIRKIAALAVACMEANGIVSRKL